MEHIPQDIRKMETKKKIVEAALLLFSTKGYYQTNSKEIAKEANVSIGSFYKYFNDKKVLLIDILKTYVDEILPTIYDQKYSSTISTIDRKIFLKNLIGKCFELHHFTLGFYQQVTMLSAVDEEIGMIFKEYKSVVMQRILEILLSYKPNLSQESQKAACIIIYSAIEGSVHTIKFSSAELEESLLVDELLRFLECYLTALQ